MSAAVRLFRLFVDSGWLAGATLAWLGVCAILVRLGLRGPAGDGALLLGLGALLAYDVLAAGKPK